MSGTILGDQQVHTNTTLVTILYLTDTNTHCTVLSQHTLEYIFLATIVIFVIYHKNSIHYFLTLLECKVANLLFISLCLILLVVVVGQSAHRGLTVS